jgi:hypothetical protein
MGGRLTHQQQMPQQMHQWMPAESPEQRRQTQQRWRQVTGIQDQCSMAVTGGDATFGDAVHRLVTNEPDDTRRSLAKLGFITIDHHHGELSGYLYNRYVDAVAERLPSGIALYQTADVETGSEAVRECATPVVVRGRGNLERQVLQVLVRVVGRA